MNTKLSKQRRYLWFPLAIGLILVGWSLASPVGSAPDEPSHIARAYSLVTGQQGLLPKTDGLAPPLPEGFYGVGAGDAPYVETRLPHYFVEKPRAGCYAFNATQPALECLPPVTSGELTVRGFQSYFVPGYAIFAGSLLRATELSGIPEQHRLTVARAASALFNGVVVSWAMLLAFPRSRWRFAGLLTLLVLMPLTAFSLSSISPSSWEISGTLLMTAGLIASVRANASASSMGTAASGVQERDAMRGVRASDAMRGALLAIAIGAFLAATARPLGLTWVGAALAISLIFIRWLPKWLMAWMGALVAFGLIWLAWSAQVQREEIADPFSAAQGGLRPREVLDLLLIGGANYFGRVTTIWSEFSNTGWLDTPTPALLGVIWAFGWVTVIFGALLLRWAGAFKPLAEAKFLIWSAAIFSLATVFLFVFLFAYADFTVQTRHLLPGVLAAATSIGVLGLVSQPVFAVRPRVVTSALWLSVALLSAAIVLTLLWTQWRYAYGLVIRDPVGLTTRTQAFAFWLPVGGLWLPPLLVASGLGIAAFALRPSQKNKVERTAGTSNTAAA